MLGPCLDSSLPHWPVRILVIIVMTQLHLFQDATICRYTHQAVEGLTAAKGLGLYRQQHMVT